MCVLKIFSILKKKVHIPLSAQLPMHSSIIVKAFEHTNVQLHDHLRCRTWRHIINQVCARVWISNMWKSMYVCMRACYLQNMRHSNIWSTRNVTLGAYDHESMRACEHSSMWAIKQGSIHEWAWDNMIFHVHMSQAKHVITCEHKWIHACEHKHQSMWLHEHPSL